MKQEPEGSTAVHAAAASGAEESLKMMLRIDPYSIDVCDYLGSTPLHYAAAEGATRTLALLLSHGANRLRMDKKGWIPLMYANFSHEREAVLRLLDDLLPMQLAKCNAIKDADSRLQVREVFTMLATIPKYYDAINDYVSQHIETLDNELNFLVQGPSTFITLQNRLRNVLRTVKMKYSLWAELRVRRDNIWKDILDARRANHRLFRSGEIVWGIKNETTGPGIGQEIRTLLAGELCGSNPAIALFEACAEDVQTYRLRKDLSSIPNVRDVEHELEIFGEFLGCCFANELLFPIAFSSVFINRIIFGGAQPRYEMNELEEIDPMFAQSLQKLLEEPGAENLCLDFTAPRSNGESVELKPRGADIDVNDNNKAEYVELMLQHTMTNTINDSYVRAIRTGFKQIAPLDVISRLKAHEIAHVISGSSTIDVDDWIKNAEVDGVDGPPQAATWLWNVIRRMNQEDRSLLLAFTTGSARLPTGGFAALRKPWKVCFVGNIVGFDNDKPLPRAATCFNRLIMPYYSTEDVLEQRLLTVVHFGSKGFACW
jgi:hypothetical protein